MNRLGEETSPYLLQHKNNPVYWQPWGEAAFSAARREEKPIFLSIGYSTCYWCHVMEHDSFEDPEVAEFLNKHFISIKVDREERPDVDQLYMDVVTGLTGRGGWPMTVFLTPDLKPFWGGTFFYRKQFLSILEQITNYWRTDRESVTRSADSITELLSRPDAAASEDSIDPKLISAVKEAFVNKFDPRHGGFGGAPKFPPAMQLSFLIREFAKGGDERLKEIINFTLDSMAKGGIYDQLGGGFHRYSVDEKWRVPHFEKMLYDNALLSQTYIEAFQATGEELYLALGEEILTYLARDMLSPEGGLYAAEDAGEVGKEGEFYIWKKEEIKALLNEEELAATIENYSVTTEGNFERGTNILYIDQSHDLSVRDNAALRSAREKLLKARSKRPRPHRDEKIISGWCALAITSLTKAHRAGANQHFLKLAQDAAQFIEKNLLVDGRLFRHYCGRRSEIPGMLEDYAFFIEALLNLYQSDFNAHWLALADRLQEMQDARFWSDEQGAYYTSDSAELILKRYDFIDGAVPSGNSVAFSNLLHFSNISFNSGRQAKIERLLSAFAPSLERYGGAVPRFLQGLQNSYAERTQLVVSVPRLEDAAPYLNELRRDFLPNHLNFVVSSKKESSFAADIFKDKEMIKDKPTFYLCRNMSCRLPVQDFAEIKSSLAGEIK